MSLQFICAGQIQFCRKSGAQLHDNLYDLNLYICDLFDEAMVK
jgi:hypothetical protein